MFQPRNGFNSDEDGMLINLVSRHPELYNAPENPFNYGLRDCSVERAKLWMNIAKEMGKDDIDCKLEWGALKNYYYRKQENLDISSSTEVNDMICKLMYTMKFLDKIPIETQYLTTINELKRINKLEKNRNANKNQEPDNSKMSSKNPLKKKIAFNTPPLDKKKKYPEPIAEMLKDVVELETKNKERKILLSLSQKPVVHEDPIRLFFNSMGETVMKLPLSLQVEAKTKVLKIITDLESRNLSAKEPK